MQYVSLIVSFLFMVALFFSLQENDIENAIFQVIIAAILFISFLIFRGDQKRNEEFMLWLALNKKELKTQSMLYNGILIDKYTKFVQYEICLSIGIFSYRNKTGYYIKDYHLTTLLNILFTTYTILFGWWGLPWGPINSFRAIVNNIFSKPKSLEKVIED